MQNTGILRAHCGSGFLLHHQICFALRARAHLPQIVPGVDPAVMPVIPAEIQGIPTHGLRVLGTGRLLEHGQQRRRRTWRLTRPPVIGLALLFTGSAGTSVPQPLEGVMAFVPVGPLNIHSRAGSDVHVHRFGVSKRHDFSIAQGAGLSPAGNPIARDSISRAMLM